MLLSIGREITFLLPVKISIVSISCAFTRHYG